MRVLALPVWVDRDMAIIGERLHEMNMFLKGSTFAQMDPAARIATYVNMHNELILRVSLIIRWRNQRFADNETLTEACSKWWSVVDEWTGYFKWQRAEEDKNLAVNKEM